MEEKLDQILKKLGDHDRRFDGLEEKLGRVETQGDKTLSLLLDTRAEVRDINTRLVRVESAVDTTYNKIDGFMSILDDNSVELVAHASAHRRYEDRLDRLEHTKPLLS